MTPLTDWFLAKAYPVFIHLRWAFRVVWQSAPRLTILNIVLICVQGLLPLLSLYLIKLVIDAVAEGLSAADRVAAFKEISLLIVASAVVALFERAVSTLAGC